MIEAPDYPHIVVAFDYRDFRIEIEQSVDQGQTVYAAWANYPLGCAIAVPCAFSRNEAIWRARQWCDRRARR